MSTTARRAAPRPARPTVRKLQIARRTVQILVLVAMLLVPTLARYANYLSARELDKTLERWQGSAAGATLRALDVALRSLPDGTEVRAGTTIRNRTRVLEYARQLRGGPWSAQIGDLSMTDPLAVAESVAAARRGARVLWLGLIVPVAIALVLGRVFCSWVCPAGLVFELTDRLRGALRWLELRPRDVRPARWTKYAVLAVGLLISAALSLPILGALYPPAILNRETHDLVFGFFDHAETGGGGIWLGGLTWMSLILVAVVLVELTVSRRWWCRYVCPGGALYGLLGWRRLVRVERRPAPCTSCGACDRACPLGLRPMHERVMGGECDNCGRCISECRDDAIGFALRATGRSA